MRAHCTDMERAARIVTLGLLALTACGTSAYGSKAKSASSSKGGSKGVVFPADPNATPAVGYANLDRASCEAELQSRSISYVPVASAIGVMAPVRLNGPLHGITFHSGLPAKQRATSPYEIMDCRLVLALDKLDVIGKAILDFGANDILVTSGDLSSGTTGFSLDGTMSLNPLSWWGAFRSGRAWTSLRPAHVETGNGDAAGK